MTPLIAEVADKNNPYKGLSPKQIITFAEKGDPDAMCLLGDLYAKGYGVTRDIEKSIEWYEKAAKAGNSDAEYWMGNSLLMDDEPGKAFEWFLKSAEKGNPVACYTLGDMFETGNGTKQDFRKAFEWYKKSAGNDYVLSCFKLGRLYYFGNGTKKDHTEALNLIKNSLLVPHNTFQREAEYLIGRILDEGNASSKKEAFNWYLKSANKGYGDAQFELAKKYIEGKNLKHDLVEAYKWLTLAGDRGNKNASEEKNKLRLKMSVKEIHKAQNEAFAFQEQIPSPDSNYISSGTAFFITGDGYLLTANHVTEKATKVEIRNSKGSWPAKIIKADEANDIALLKATGEGFDYLPLEDSRNTLLGETVFTVGFPNLTIQGIQPKYTKGEVSSLAGIEDIPWNFQISIPVQPGNSGGPLVNRKGSVIGIIISVLAQQRTWQLTGSIPQNVTYSVKSNIVLEFLEGIPEVSGKLKNETIKDAVSDPVKTTENSVAIVIAYRMD